MEDKDLQKMKVCNIEDLDGPKSKEELDEMKAPFEEYCKKIFDVGNEFRQTGCHERHPLDELYHVYLHPAFRYQYGGNGG